MYARVSTTDQTPENQLGVLRAFAAARVAGIELFLAALRRRQVRVGYRAYSIEDYSRRIIDAAVEDEKIRAAMSLHIGNIVRKRFLGLRTVHMGLYLPPNVRKTEAARRVDSTWFQSVMWFIPRGIRSPWFDHLLEDREQMAAEGRSQRFIAIATFVQCVSLMAHLLWDLFRDVVTPFKPRVRK